MTRMKDLTGKRFGRLIVIGYSHSSKTMGPMWKCMCDCGNTTIVSGHNLKHCTKSCGCYRKEVTSNKSTVHHMKGTKMYNTWLAMKRRCYSPEHEGYKNYGGRGIKVCDEWKNDFMNFYTWAISHGYKDNLTIDRINVNESYTPNNCKWSNIKEQQRNRTNNRMIKFKGQIKCLAEWAEEYNINPSALKLRLCRNWPIEKALLTPIKNNKKNCSQ